MERHGRFPAELRERAVRLVFETQDEYSSQTAAMKSVAEKVGGAFDTLRRWIRQVERDQGFRPGLTTDERQHMKDLEREVSELRKANEILRKASADFAQASMRPADPYDGEVH